MSGISSGIGCGFPAITTQLLLRDDAEIVLTPSQVSWFASVTAITCPLGGPISGYLSEKIGRRNSLMVINVVAIISFLLIGYSSRVNPQIFFAQLIVSRAIAGFTIGMITTPAVMYISEICHTDLRGRMTILSTPFFIAFGMVVSYVLGYLIPVSLNDVIKFFSKSIVQLPDGFSCSELDFRWNHFSDDCCPVCHSRVACFPRVPRQNRQSTQSYCQAERSE
jgi:MFS family permease